MTIMADVYAAGFILLTLWGAFKGGWEDQDPVAWFYKFLFPLVLVWPLALLMAFSALLRVWIYGRRQA